MDTPQNTLSDTQQGCFTLMENILNVVYKSADPNPDLYITSLTDLALAYGTERYQAALKEKHTMSIQVDFKVVDILVRLYNYCIQPKED